MSKLKFFFHSFVQSASNPGYYKEVTKSRFLSSLKYFSFFVLLTFTLSFIVPLLLSLPFIPEAVKEIEKLFPPDLEIKIQNGEVSTNQPEPYYLLNENSSVVVIDTTGALTDIPEGRSGVLVTKNKIITRDQSRIEERSYNLSSFKDSLIINKDLVSQIVKKLKPFILAVLVVFFIFLYPLIFLSALTFNLIYILIITFFPTALSKILHLGHTYKNLLKISLHAFTLPKLVQIIFGDTLKVNFPPFSFTLFYLAFITIILATINKKQQNAQ